MAIVMDLKMNRKRQEVIIRMQTIINIKVNDKEVDGFRRDRRG